MSHRFFSSLGAGTVLSSWRDDAEVEGGRREEENDLTVWIKESQDMVHNDSCEPHVDADLRGLLLLGETRE